MKENEQDKRTPAGDAFTDLILETFRFNGSLMETGDRLIEHLGVTSALWQVLGTLQDAPLPMAQIARNMGRTRQSVRRSAYRLKDRGLVVFLENPDHQRAKLIDLTQKGRDILEQINQIQVNWANEVSSKFSVKELHDTIQTMRRLVDKLHI
jgi:DNA-binding MarR family transcriptional regulator